MLRILGFALLLGVPYVGSLPAAAETSNLVLVASKGEPKAPRGGWSNKDCETTHEVIDGEAQHMVCCTFTWDHPHQVVGPICTGWMKDEGGHDEVR
jgi:hypothetical protein